jgi:Tol biopolymer transport system component
MKKLLTAAILVVVIACGILIFQPGNTYLSVSFRQLRNLSVPQRQLAFVDFDGTVKPIRNVPASIFGPRISPNGKQVAYRDGGAVWIVDLTRDAVPRRLTTEPGEGPIWSPDGERIAFISIFENREALFWRKSDGTGTAEMLVDRARAPEHWSAVNQEFSFITLVGPSGDGGDYDIWTYSRKQRKPRRSSSFRPLPSRGVASLRMANGSLTNPTKPEGPRFGWNRCPGRASVIE